MKKAIRKICILYNKAENISDESDVDTQNSALIVCDELENAGYDVQMVGIFPTEINEIKKIRAELVFNLVEWAGVNTEYGVRTAKILERMKIPFTGSGSWGYLLSCNKLKMKKEMRKNKIPTPGLRYPAIVKPSMEHCGIGIDQKSVVKNESEMKDRMRKLRDKFHQPMIAEEFIDGRELQVTILERNGRPWVLPAAEVVFDSPGTVLSYEMKWVEKSKEYDQAHMEAAKLDQKMVIDIEKLAKKCYLKLGGRDYPRLDIRVREKEIFVLEINNNPGLDWDLDSGMGVSARLAGFKSYAELLIHIVENAYLRFANLHDSSFV